MNTNEETLSTSYTTDHVHRQFTATDCFDNHVSKTAKKSTLGIKELWCFGSMTTREKCITKLYTLMSAVVSLGFGMIV